MAKTPNKNSGKDSTKTTIARQQKRVIEKFEKGNSVVVAHSMGSGKTFTALEGMRRVLDKNPDGYALAIVPASLANNMKKEIHKHGLGAYEDRIKITSYDKAVNELGDHLENKPVAVVADEAQKLRNTDTKRHRVLKQLLSDKSLPKMFLTATPSYNNLHDTAVLVNLAAGKKVLPDNKEEFENKFIEKIQKNPGFVKSILGVTPGEEKRLKNTKELKKVLNKYVDYHNAIKDTPENFPDKEESTILVGMSPKQKRVYDYLEGTLPLPLRIKIRAGLPLDKKEAGSLNAFSVGIRQVSNSMHGYDQEVDTPKMITAVSRLRNQMESDKNFRGVVYSNFLGSGLDHYQKKLDDLKIPYTSVTGKMTSAAKKQAVEDYNSGKTKVLLISSSGGEGLDLKGTKLVQVLDPHFNKSKIDQVVGRGIRFHSHHHLPKEERKVKVEHYVTTRPLDMLDRVLGSKGKSIDAYLLEKSKEKDELNQQMYELMKTASATENKYLVKIAQERAKSKKVDIILFDSKKNAQDGVIVGGIMGGVTSLNKSLSGKIRDKIPHIQNKYLRSAAHASGVVGLGALGGLMGASIAGAVKRHRGTDVATIEIKK